MTVRRRMLLGGIGGVALGGTAACRSTAARPASSSPTQTVTTWASAVTADAPAETLLHAYDVLPQADLASVLRQLHRALGAAPAIVSVGAALFDGRTQLARPRLLSTMPSFPADALDPLWCHGDVLVQTYGGSAKPLTVAGLQPRWQIRGLHPPSADGTVRNLFGFREGAGNPDATDQRLMDSLLWVRRGDDEPDWCAGGCYQVVRLIRLATSIWRAETVTQQERVFGRRRDTDAPLAGGVATDRPDYSADPDGRLTPLDAHIRRANPHTAESDTHRVLRRGWSYRQPAAADQPADEGQIFTCYQRDLEKGFVAIQQRLAGEALERYTLTFGGGYYFVLPEPGPADYRGRTLAEGD